MKIPKGKYQKLCGSKEEQIYTTLDSVEANMTMNKMVESYLYRFRGNQPFNEWYAEFLKEMEKYDTDF